MRASILRTVLAGVILVWPVAASAQRLPTREGTCVRSKIAAVEQRLRDGPNGPFIPGSGSAVRFANGGYQVAYAEIEAVQTSRTGDPVFICVIHIPRRCPPGDVRDGSTHDKPSHVGILDDARSGINAEGVARWPRYVFGQADHVTALTPRYMERARPWSMIARSIAQVQANTVCPQYSPQLSQRTRRRPH
jgi:hypothetical protein